MTGKKLRPKGPGSGFFRRSTVILGRPRLEKTTKGDRSGPPPLTIVFSVRAGAGSIRPGHLVRSGVPAPLEGGYSSSVSNGSEEISNGMRRSRRTALTNRLTATEAFRPTDAQNASNCRLTYSSIRALSVV